MTSPASSITPTEQIIKQTLISASKCAVKTFLYIQCVKPVHKAIREFETARSVTAHNFENINIHVGFKAETCFLSLVGIGLRFSALGDAFKVAENTAILGYRGIKRLI